MSKCWPLIRILTAVVLAGCTQESLPPGILEFEVPAGKFQVAAPDEWVETPELGGYTAVESPDLDLVFSVLSVDPTDEEMSSYRDPRDYEVNSRRVTVYNGALGHPPGQYFGIEYYAEEIFHAVVAVDAHRYHVVLIVSSTAAPRDDHDQILAGLAASLKPVP